MATVKVIKETRKYNELGKWDLAFQYCEYCYDDGSSENGYRFIWITPEGHLQPARGQARIPSTSDILKNHFKKDGDIQTGINKKNNSNLSSYFFIIFNLNLNLKLKSINKSTKNIKPPHLKNIFLSISTK